MRWSVVHCPDMVLTLYPRSNLLRSGVRLLLCRCVRLLSSNQSSTIINPHQSHQQDKLHLQQHHHTRPPHRTHARQCQCRALISLIFPYDPPFRAVSVRRPTNHTSVRFGLLPFRHTRGCGVGHTLGGCTCSILAVLTCSLLTCYSRPSLLSSQMYLPNRLSGLVM